MRPSYITEDFLSRFARTALAEDVGDGDHSTLAAISSEARGQAQLLIKESGVLAGVQLATSVFSEFDKSLQCDLIHNDGDPVSSGDVAFVVHGKIRSILTTERLVLNCMQRMSGIASYTARLVALIAGTGATLMDTRKTTPNFRLMEKWAVVIGGGHNHRIGLYDMIMLKDNHIDAAGGIEQAIFRTKEYLRATKKELRIEIETRTLDEVDEVIRVGGVDVIMLDNMNTETMKEAVRRIDGRFRTEASGGITEETIRSIATCGVDYISVGALTHSVRSVDMSLKIVD